MNLILVMTATVRVSAMDDKEAAAVLRNIQVLQDVFDSGKTCGDDLAPFFAHLRDPAKVELRQRGEIGPLYAALDEGVADRTIPCGAAQQLLWLLTTWDVDAALAAANGMPQEKRATQLLPLLECTPAYAPTSYAAARRAAPATAALPTCHALTQLSRRCKSSPSRADREQIFKAYALASVQEEDEPDDEDAAVTSAVSPDWLDPAELAEEGDEESEDDAEASEKFVLQRVQQLNFDLKVVQCAKARLSGEATCSDRKDLQESSQSLLLELQWGDLLKKQEESKCCCSTDHHNGTAYQSCRWTTKDGLVNARCKEAEALNADVCGASPIDAMRPFVGARTQDQSLLEVGVSLSGQALQKARFDLDQYDEELWTQRELAIFMSDFSREHTRSYGACEAGARVHSFKVTDGETAESSKCLSGHNHYSQPMGCPVGIDMFCPHSNLAQRCCCSAEEVKKSRTWTAGHRRTAGECAATLTHVPRPKRRLTVVVANDQMRTPFGVIADDSHFDTRVLTKVVEGGNAWKLGIRPGCEIVEIGRGGVVRASFWLKRFRTIATPFEMLLHCDAIEYAEQMPQQHTAVVRRADDDPSGEIAEMAPQLSPVEALAFNYLGLNRSEEQEVPLVIRVKDGVPTVKHGGGSVFKAFESDDSTSFFTDENLDTEEAWSERERKEARKMAARLEKYVRKWDAAAKEGFFVPVIEGESQMIMKNTGSLRRLTAKTNKLTREILALFHRNSPAGEPTGFSDTVQCASHVLHKLQTADDESKAMVSQARAVKSAIQKVLLDENGAQRKNAIVSRWSVVLRVVGKLALLPFRLVLSVAGALMYLPLVPFVMFAEGMKSVQNSGQLWRFPIGFLFRGPVISLFGRAHFQRFGDFGARRDDPFFRWGVAGAAGRAFDSLTTAPAREVVKDVPRIMNLLVQLHRMLRIGETCGATVQFAK